MTKFLMSRLPYIAVLLVMLIFLAWLYQPVQAVNKTKRAKSVKVETMQVVSKPLVERVEAVGTASANEIVNIYSEYAARVKALHFDDGDQVKQGQLLLTLFNEEEAGEVAELEANLLEAKAQFTRLAELRQTNSVSASEFEEQQAKVDATQALLSQAKAKLAKYQIAAPFDGVLGRRHVSVGAFITPTTEITTLYDISKIKADFSVPERYFPQLQKGQTIRVNTIAYSQEFSGVIQYIEPKIELTTRSVKVRALIDNSSNLLRPGMMLLVVVELARRDAILIPENALIPIEDKHFIYRVLAGKADKVEVQLGLRRFGEVEVVSGLTTGEQLITAGTVKLKPGTQVEPVANVDMDNNQTEQGGIR